MDNFWKPWKKIARLSPFGVATSKSSSWNRDVSTVLPSSHASFEDWNFDVETDPRLVQELFDRLTNTILTRLCRTGNRRLGQPSAVRYETGRLPGGRRFVFFQPWSQTGWLLEEEASGWRLSRADKIVHQRQFLRANQPWEAACLLRPRWRSGLVRISSKRLGQDPLSYPIYEEEIVTSLRQVIGPQLSS
jgi:hypothetical protein